MEDYRTRRQQSWADRSHVVIQLLHCLKMSMFDFDKILENATHVCSKGCQFEVIPHLWSDGLFPDVDRFISLGVPGLNGNFEDEYQLIMDESPDILVECCPFCRSETETVDGAGFLEFLEDHPRFRCREGLAPQIRLPPPGALTKPKRG